MGCYGSKPALQPAAAPNLSAAPIRRHEGLPSRVKLVLLGDAGVGKSCLALRYVHGQFDPNKQTTVGAAFLAKDVYLPGGQHVKFEIWDTAGQERYYSLAPLYYRGADAAAVVYDITSPDSFERGKFWVRELQRNGPLNIVSVLVGNKCDVAFARQVSEDEGRDFADSNMMIFVETSAKTGANVAEIFESIAGQLAGGLPVSSNAAVY